MLRKSCCVAPVFTFTIVLLNSFTHNASAFVNGSFEEPALPDGLWGVTWAPEIRGWSGDSSAFDINRAIWSSTDGEQHIEFNHRNAQLAQELSGLSRGTRHVIAFDLAGNPDRPTVYGLQLEVREPGSQLKVEDFWFSSVGQSRADVGWREESLTFVPTGNTATVIFRRIDNDENGFGPELDNVRLSVVPITGDLNNDGSVDAADAAMLSTNWGTVLTGDPFADLNDDGQIDAADAAFVLSDWTGDGADVLSVPEPVGSLLGFFALLVAACLKQFEYTRCALKKGKNQC